MPSGGKWGPYLFCLLGGLPLVAIAGYAVWCLVVAHINAGAGAVYDTYL